MLDKETSHEQNRRPPSESPDSRPVGRNNTSHNEPSSLPPSWVATGEDSSSPSNDICQNGPSLSQDVASSGQEKNFTALSPPSPTSLEVIEGETLADVLAKYKITLQPDKVALLDLYRRLVWEWNTKINLTRHTDLEKFVTRDVLDSLMLSEFLEPEELVLDVGTGAGVPGVIVAILRPDLRVVLCESVIKKARIVEKIVCQLGLKIPVVAARVQDLLGQSTQFNTLMARAIGSLRDVLKWLRPHWRYFDRLLLVKGRSWLEERGTARHYGMMHGLALRKLKEYHNPANDAYNVILQVCPEDRVGKGKKCQLRELRSHQPKLPQPPIPPPP